jgi:hypothetical protein
MNTIKYIVKLSQNVRSEGRSVDGEYDGGNRLSDARIEAATFAQRTIGGRITGRRSMRRSGAQTRLAATTVFE